MGKTKKGEEERAATSVHTHMYLHVHRPTIIHKSSYVRRSVEKKLSSGKIIAE